MSQSNQKFIPVTNETARAHPLYGVKGWLIVFGLGVVLGFMSGWGKLVVKFHTDYGFKGSVIDLLQLDGMGAIRIMFFTDLALVLVILFLMLTKHRHFRVVSSAVLVLVYPLSLLILSMFEGDIDVYGLVKGFFVWVIPTVVWVTYLYRSKRVRVTYENTVQYDLKAAFPESHVQYNKSKARSPNPITDLAQTTKISEVNTQLNHITANSIASANIQNEDLWAQALAELESDQRKAGLWAQSYAEADGNEATAKARYIKTRANTLIADSEARLKHAELSKQAQLLEEKRVASIARAQSRRSGPKGECPYCKTIILVDSMSCIKCKTIFKTDESTSRNWIIKPLSALDVRLKESIDRSSPKDELYS